MEWIIFLLILMLLAAVAWRHIRLMTVYEYERGLKYFKGAFAELLEPGQYWFMPIVTTIHKVDVRPKYITLPGQEVLSADGVTLKVSLAASYEVENPNVAVNDAQDYEAALYLHLQIALRDIIGTSTRKYATIASLLSQSYRTGERRTTP